ncbi:MAG: citrate synthase [Elusimicrobia bacterium]|nr:citrate synthase [Elusimicrobiota bacterium]
MPEAAPSFSPGLEGVVAAKSRLCQIDGTQGKLYYLGYAIEDLAEHSSFEEVCFLLWRERLPRARELEELRGQLQEYRQDCRDLFDFVGRFPHTARPMDMLRTCVSWLGCRDPHPGDASGEANFRRAVAVTAHFPTAVAAFHRFREKQSPVPPHARLSHAANFLYMLTGKQPSDLAARVMDVALILHADHEMNASTFASLVTASTMSDLYSALTTGVGTLKGPLHGGANEAVVQMLEKIGSVENVESYLSEAFAQKKKIMGFGHRVYKTYDPRARIFKRYADELSRADGDRRFFEINERIEELMQKRVGSHGIYPNVDFYSGIVYRSLGVASDLFTPIFSIARAAGWTAHVLESWQKNRIYRPASVYEGPGPRAYVPLDER